jgi:DNA polymerase-1
MKKDDAQLAEKIITLMLEDAKVGTMGGIYRRIRPGRDGRIRTVLSPVGTETGRLNSKDSFLEPSTNLQNLPKKAALMGPLYNVRDCIRAKAGCRFVEADLSQAEARAVAVYSKDTELQKVFASGADIHKWTASRIFDVEIDKVTKEQRMLGKMARHALNYGMGVMRFMAQINKDADITGLAITAKTAKRVHAGYHEQHPRLGEWWEEIMEQVQWTRTLTTALGRRRIFPGVLRPTDINAYLPQSTIADMLNIGLVRVWDHGRWPIVMQVHDSVICEVPTEDAEECAGNLKRMLDVPIDIDGVMLRVPVDTSIGPTWSTLA